MSEQLENKTRQHPAEGADDDEIHLLDLLIVLARHKRLVIGIPIVTGTLALAVSLLMTPIFTGTTKVMPPQQQSSGVAGMLGQLGGLAGAAGGIAGLKNPNDLYVAMLQSRTLVDNLINRFKLKERYKAVTMDDARSALSNVSNIASGKDGLISIEVVDEDPKFAADLANAYFSELATLTQSMAISEASQRRLFFEKQLQQAKQGLSDAEIALKQVQEKTGLIQLNGQSEAIIKAAAELKAQIASKEVGLGAMRMFATANNPDYIRIQQELNGLRAQLTKIETGMNHGKGDISVSTSQVPEVGLEYVRRVRDVKYYETIFELLARQYELAKIDEAKDASTIQQLDKAVPAERKSKPKRAIITLIGLLGGTLLGILVAFMREAYIRSRERADNSHRWQELSAAWKKTTP